MSIIQEALKKAESKADNGHDAIPPVATIDLAHPKIPQIKTPAQKKLPASKSVPRLAVPLVIILVALLAVAIARYMGSFLPVMARHPAPSQKQARTASSQEVSVKPLPGASVPAGEPSKKIALPLGRQPQIPSLTLSGIMYLENGPRAIINDSIVGVGDAVEGASVTQINEKDVVLEYKDREITLKIK